MDPEMLSEQPAPTLRRARIVAVAVCVVAFALLLVAGMRTSEPPRPRPGADIKPMPLHDPSSPVARAVHFDPFPDHEEVLLKGSKWGFINAAGKVVIDPQFERAGPFKEGRAAVRVNGKWGYIGPDAKLVIEPKYTDAQPFSEGYAAVKTERGWAYIDTRGIAITRAEFDAAEPFREGMALVKVGKKYGYVDAAGATVVEPQYAWAGDFGEGVAPVRAEEDGAMVYIDPTGKVVLDPKAKVALTFRQGRAAIEVDGKWGFIDHAGRRVIPPQFEQLGHPARFFDGLCLVKRNKKWGYIDRAGVVVIPLKYWGANGFFEGLARVEEKNDETGDWGFIDTTGRLVFANTRAYGRSANGLIRVQVSEGYVFLDRTGKQVIDKLEHATDFSEGLSAFAVNVNFEEVRQRWEQINKQGIGF